MPEILKRGGIEVRLYTSGRGAHLVSWHTATGRQLRSFADPIKARRHAEQVLAGALTRGAAMDAITADDARQIAALRELLPPGISMREVVLFWLERNASVRSISVHEAVDEFVAAKIKAGRSKRATDDLAHRLRHFCGAFACALGDIRARDISEWLHAGDAAPQTRLNNLRVVRQFFGWARRAGYLPRAVPTAADDVEAPRVPPGHIEIFRPADIAKLLAALTGPARAYVAIGAFAGLRSAEILRLRWEDIGATHIRVGARASKTRQMRLVPIADNLRAWLSTCGQTTGPVAHQYDQRHAAATARTLDVRWVPNGLRHSYGSYRLAATNDLAALALEMGNSGSVILQHYRQLVTPDAAAAWWAITPERPANVADFVA